MQTLLIADQDPVRREVLTDALRGNWEIHTCADGETTIDLLRTLSPDALILNLKLPQKNGFDVLAACFPQLPPVMIALCANRDERTELSAMRWGVDHVFQIPFKTSMIVACLSAARSLQNIEMKRASNHLRVLGAYSGDKGYWCLMAAAPFYRENPDQCLKTELYPRIARTIGLSDDRCVERDIRATIEKAWRHRNVERWANYFPVDADGDVKKPSNLDFIASLALAI